MDKKELGERLKQARESAGLKQAEVMAIMGWGGNNSTLSNYERGIREPDIERLSMMLDLYGTSLSEFFAGGEFDQAVDSRRFPPSVIKGIAEALAKADDKGRQAILDSLKIR